ncbi:nucleoside triphosphate pyrophosphohydrolase [Seleniivibrio sp.]|uniref:nucleoside triphosphate pyrophosphohydrolase n=1 Tax=Seleniivibrio sp. TaxID=2898801 RepID=UPI0025F48E0D|nr:nucleoside triphosphate pyrophosphohydrolase [Seleniivibrio sp.]MCD8552744.1 nucleoside triphosphate pyrophosphohydrolase [Seleniivibrio sp.]
MSEEFEKLVNIVKTLRSENGCPWDREQNLFSIKNLFIEEAFELLDALDRKDIPNIREELGDVLFHTVFHSVMAEDEKRFNIDEVLSEVSAKLVRRHPHVFGTLSVSDSDEVIANWDEIKKEEKKAKQAESILSDIPAAYPSVMRALKIQEKVRKVGFDWEKPEDCMAKLDEEIDEFKEAFDEGDREKMEHEIGDVLFSIINMSRFCKVNPDEALRKANDRFIKRFKHIEKELKKNGRSCEEAALDEMENLWIQAKGLE